MLPKRFLFRFSVPCFYRKKLPAVRGAGLEAKYRLPSLGELEGEPATVDVSAAWSETGLALTFRISGKRQPIWCRMNRPEDSDGVHLWIDTRDVHTVHRASRFCHRFFFLPTGGGKRLDQPLAQWMPINRARGQPNAIAPGKVEARSEISGDGYRLDVRLAAEALTGFEPAEHPRLGFQYAILDRELGEQTFAAGSPMPYQEDPSLWGTLELVK